MKKEASTCELRELVTKFIPESIGKQIEKQCQSIYPLKDVVIRKVKMIRFPKVDVYKLAELHHEDVGEKVAEATPAVPKAEVSEAPAPAKMLVGE